RGADCPRGRGAERYAHRTGNGEDLMASEVDIYNMALDLLDEEVAIDPDDDRAPVRWMRRNFAPVRDAILRRNPWNFAIKRVVLPALVTPPAFGWKYRYQLPSDCLRPLPLESCGEF